MLTLGWAYASSCAVVRVQGHDESDENQRGNHDAVHGTHQLTSPGITSFSEKSLHYMSRVYTACRRFSAARRVRITNQSSEKDSCLPCPLCTYHVTIGDAQTCAERPPNRWRFAGLLDATLNKILAPRG